MKACSFLWSLFMGVVLCLVALPVSSLELSMSEDGRHFNARHDDGREWSRRVAHTEDVSSDDGNKPVVTHHLEHAGMIYLCHKRQSMMLSSDTGEVLWHDSLRGTCESWLHMDGTIKLKVSPPDKQARTSPEYVMLNVTREGVERPQFFFDSDYGLATFRRLSMVRNVMEEMERDGLISGEVAEFVRNQGHFNVTLTAPQRQEIKGLIDTLEAHVKADPTHLGYLAYIARSWRVLGERAQYNLTIERAFAIDARYHTELTIFANYLMPFGPVPEDTFARAFDLALTQALREGYEPLANRALVSVMLFLAKPSKIVGEDFWSDSNQDHDALIEAHAVPHMQRIWRFAPNAEMASAGYGALAVRYARRQDAEKEAVWRARQRSSVDSLSLGLPSSVLTEAGHGFYIIWASGVVVWLLLLVKLGRVAFNIVPEHTPGHVRYNLLNRLTRAELLGFFALPIILLSAYSMTSRAVLVIGEATNMPMAWDMGCYDCVEVREMLEGQRDLDVVHFMMGYGAQKAGDLKRARNHYGAIRGQDVRAQHNLGVLCLQQGDDAGARDRLGKLVDDPEVGELARYNLDGSGESARVKDQRRAGQVAGPIVASPGGQDRLALVERQVVEGIPSLKGLRGSEIPGMDLMFDSWGIAIQSILYMLMLHALIWRPERKLQVMNKRRVIGWAISSLVPGASRHWGVCGASVCVAWLTSCAAMGAYIMVNDQLTTNTLAMLTMSAFSRSFGVDTTLSMSADLPWVTFAKAWWVFLLVNLVCVAIMERVRPDPDGPFAKITSD